MKASTVLWHLMRLAVRLEVAASRAARAVRQHFSPCCNARAPRDYAPAGIRCTLPPHHGNHAALDRDWRTEDGRPVRWTWPGHPAGSARR